MSLHDRDGYKETEYQEYLKQKEGVKHQLNSGEISVQDRHQQLAEERENELSRQSSIGIVIIEDTEITSQ